jgi:hypothetical protein
MQDGDIWTALGVNLSAMMAGIAGGIVGAWADGKSGIKAWFSYVVCGALTGAYLGEPATHLIPFTNPSGAGFIVGGSAMLLMRLSRGALTRYGLKLGLNGNGGQKNGSG